MSRKTNNLRKQLRRMHERDWIREAQILELRSLDASLRRSRDEFHEALMKRDRHAALTITVLHPVYQDASRTRSLVVNFYPDDFLRDFRIRGAGIVHNAGYMAMQIGRDAGEKITRAIMATIAAEGDAGG